MANMPNDFQSIQSGSGILQNAYPDEAKSPTSAALSKRRKKMYADKGMPTEPDDNGQISGDSKPGDNY